MRFIVSRRNYTECCWKIGVVLSRRVFVTGIATAILARGEQSSKITIVKTPDNGVQPQAAVDEDGTIHLVYLYGDPSAADVGYVRKNARAAGFCKPIRVNSEPGSAIALGTVRGARLALGRKGQVHVAWNGSSKAAPKVPANAFPMLYSRLTQSDRTFEPQRNLMQSTAGLDGGGAVAADSSGNVYVLWHGQHVVNGKSDSGEDKRRVYLTHSTDCGATFSQERAISPEFTGACGCCGMAAIATRRGELFVMYRTAREIIHRDMELLVSNDRGRSFRAADLQPWEIGACPMSTSSMIESQGRVFAAWETDKQVFFGDVTRGSSSAVVPVAAPGSGQDRKHPAIAVNASGEKLIAWTDGTGWKRGGTLSWALFRNGAVELSSVDAGTVPAWGLPTVVAVRDEFLIVC